MAKGFEEVKKIPRSQIKRAEYNPRIIDEET